MYRNVLCVVTDCYFLKAVCIGHTVNLAAGKIFLRYNRLTVEDLNFLLMLQRELIIHDVS